MTPPVSLEDIAGCLRGVIPAPFATCARDGTPNVSYMSLVHYIDAERVGLSRQFLNKSRANLDANPFAQVRVVDPDTVTEYTLDLEYLHTETDGPIFDAMAANIEAAATPEGMAGVFRLRGVDVYRVLRCIPVGTMARAPARPSERDVLGRLDEFQRRLSCCTDYADASRTALEALDDLFGFRQSILLVRDEQAERLFAIASSGYATGASGAEVPMSSGVIGVAASRGQVVSVANVARSRIMQEALRSADDDEAREIPLPGLAGAQSVAAVPLVLQGAVGGVLYLESEHLGEFGPHNERLLRLLGGYVATALRALELDEPDRTTTSTPARPDPSGVPLRVTYYQADDSLFVDDEYVVKGVPGRILWRLLNAYATERRDTFTNRELRLDERLGLPAGNDNLEARLLVLRKRLAGGRHGMEIERVGRGRFALLLERPVELSEIATSGPMKAAHEPR